VKTLVITPDLSELALIIPQVVAIPALVWSEGLPSEGVPPIELKRAVSVVDVKILGGAVQIVAAFEDVLLPEQGCGVSGVCIDVVARCDGPEGRVGAGDIREQAALCKGRRNAKIYRPILIHTV